MRTAHQWRLRQIFRESQLDSTEVLNRPTVQGSEPSNSQVSQELSTHPNRRSPYPCRNRRPPNRFAPVVI